MNMPADTSETVEFRLATEADAGPLKNFIRSYCEFDHIPFDAKKIGSSLRILIEDGTVGRAWLVCRNNRPIGYMIVVFWFDLEFGGRCALLTDVYLEPAHRRRGLGRKMLQHVEDFCRNSGIGVLELQVQQSNTAALSFYEACGFQAHDRVPMSKRLV
jgi:ribosomal protein S18 acetylase RimI-like enzyme